MISKPGIGISGLVNPTKKGVSLAESIFVLKKSSSHSHSYPSLTKEISEKPAVFNCRVQDNSCIVCKEIKNIIFKASYWELGQLLSAMEEMIL